MKPAWNHPAVLRAVYLTGIVVQLVDAIAQRGQVKAVFGLALCGLLAYVSECLIRDDDHMLRSDFWLGLYVGAAASIVTLGFFE